MPNALRQEIMLLISLIGAAAFTAACEGNPIGPTVAGSPDPAATPTTVSAETSVVSQAPAKTAAGAAAVKPVASTKTVATKSDAPVCAFAHPCSPAHRSAAAVQTHPNGPAAPTNVAVTVGWNQWQGYGIGFTWTQSPERQLPAGEYTPNFYVVYVGNEPGFDDANPVWTSMGTCTTWSGSSCGVTAGEVHGQFYVHVRAMNAYGYGPPSSPDVPLAIGTVETPGAPSALSAVSPSPGTLNLSWAPPASRGLPTTYVIEAGSATGLANLANFDTGNTSTTYVANNVVPGTYYLRVRAKNASGTSGPSNEAVGLVLGSTPGTCTSAPGAPRSLTVTSVSAGDVSLSWLAPSSGGTATSYILEAGTSAGLSNLVNFDTGSSATTYSTTRVSAGSYYVRVRAKNACGTSAPSNDALVYVISFTGEVQVSVSWDQPADVDLHVVDPSGEEIYYGNPSSSSGGQLDVDSNSACSIDNKNIENIRWTGSAPAGTYTVRVDYWKSCGVAQTNYVVTVKNGVVTTTYTGTFTGSGDGGGRGSGRTITTFSHAASINSGPVTAPATAMPIFVAPEKLRQNAGSR